MKAPPPAAPKQPYVIEAEFFAAAGPESSLPPPSLPEIAFAGRSNVGKSTLMNMLLGRRNLVRTSATPGCTRTINMFKARCSDGLELFLVDLPGFGYAGRSKAERTSWGTLIEGYLRERASLRGVALLIDVRRGLEEEEHALLDFIASTARQDRKAPPVITVATKIDKLPLSQRKPGVAKLGKGVVGVSGETGEGGEALWKRLRWAVGVEPAVVAAAPAGEEKA